MPDVTRRRLLSTGLGLTLTSLAGLTISCDPADPPNAASGAPEPTPQPAPDLDLLGDLVSAKTELVGAYERSVAAHPATTDALAAFLARHQAHLSVLTQLQQGAAEGPLPTTLPEPGPPSASPRPRSTDTNTDQPDTQESEAGEEAGADEEPGPDEAGVPDSPADALTVLADAERADAEDRLLDVEAAHSPDLAQLVASIAACEQTHAMILASIDFEPEDTDD